MVFRQHVWIITTLTIIFTFLNFYLISSVKVFGNSNGLPLIIIYIINKPKIVLYVQRLGTFWTYHIFNFKIKFLLETQKPVTWILSAYKKRIIYIDTDVWYTEVPHSVEVWSLKTLISSYKKTKLCPMYIMLFFNCWSSEYIYLFLFWQHLTKLLFLDHFVPSSI